MGKNKVIGHIVATCFATSSNDGPGDAHVVGPVTLGDGAIGGRRNVFVEVELAERDTDGKMFLGVKATSFSAKHVLGQCLCG